MCSLDLPNTKWLLNPAPIRKPVAIGGYAQRPARSFHIQSYRRVFASSLRRLDPKMLRNN